MFEASACSKHDNVSSETRELSERATLEANHADTISKERVTIYGSFAALLRFRITVGKSERAWFANNSTRP